MRASRERALHQADGDPEKPPRGPAHGLQPGRASERHAAEAPSVAGTARTESPQGRALHLLLLDFAAEQSQPRTRHAA